jgi:hypothetical protein
MGPLGSCSTCLQISSSPLFLWASLEQQKQSQYPTCLLQETALIELRNKYHIISAGLHIVPQGCAASRVELTAYRMKNCIVMLAKENCNASSKLSFLLMLYLFYVLYTQKNRLVMLDSYVTHDYVCTSWKVSLQPLQTPPVGCKQQSCPPSCPPPPFFWFGEGG